MKFLTNVRHNGDFFEAGEDVPDLPDDVLRHLADNGAIELDGGVPEDAVDEDEDTEQA